MTQPINITELSVTREMLKEKMSEVWRLSNQLRKARRRIRTLHKQLKEKT